MKRGQVTIFVVLGLVLIAAIAGVLYIVKNQERPRVDVPDDLVFEYNDVKGFVEGCTYSLAKEAIIRIGEHGGYLNPQESGVMFIPGFPTRGSGFEFVDGTGLVIPYWYYMSSPDSCTNNCQFKSKQPTLLDIESQIEEYVETNLDSCLNNFKEFEKIGLTVKEVGDVKAKVTIGDTRTIVQLEKELVLEKNDASVKILEFSTELEVKLKHMINIASHIVKASSHEGSDFLGVVTREIIAETSLGEHPPIPPMYAPPKIGFGGSDVWLLSDVKERLQTELMTHVPTMQVLYARNSDFFDTDDPFINSLYNQKILYLNESLVSLDDLFQYDVNFVYLGWWPIYAKIKPGGQVITPKPRGIRTKFFSFGYMEYNFAYDISYPILLVMRDDTAFGDEGFTLQFGIETNMRNNVPMSANFNDWPTFEEENLIDYCDWGQRTSGDIKITTVDEMTNEPIKDVLTTYECVEESCLIGYSQGEQGVLNTKLPPCWGGYFTALKDGYYSSPVLFDSEIDEAANIIIPMIEEKTLKVDIRKHVVETNFGSDSLMTSYSALDDEEEVFLYIERVLQPGESEYTKFVTIKGLEPATINLVPGNYTVEATLTRNLGPGMDPEEIVIPEQEIQGETIPKTVFNSSFFEGGLTFDINHTWTVTQDNCNKSKVVFHVVGLDVNNVNSYDDLEQMDAYTEYSVSERTLLEPEFE
ncbi:MAG: hypothetical protein ABIB43_05280 [archaeon]